MSKGGESMKEGWKIVKLGEVCESRLGKTLNSSTDIGKPYEYLCAVNIQWDKIDLSILKTTLFSNEEVEKFKIQKGDLLVCEGGEAGRAAIWDNEKTILYQNAIHRIRFKNNVMLPRFCMHYLRKLKFEGIIDKNYARGATIKHLVTKSLYSIPIPLPPLEEQHRIVGILDASFEKIDALKKNAEENLKNAKALFQQVLAQELQPKEGWVEKKLGEVCEKITDGSHNPPKGIEYSEYRMLSSQNVYDGYLLTEPVRYLKKEDFENENKRTNAQTGDVLLTIVGTIGRTCVLSGNESNITFQRSVAILRPKNDIDSYYLMYYLISQNKNLNIKSQGVAQKGIYLKQLVQYPVVLPPLKEQHRIVRTLDTLSEKCRRLEQVAQQTIRECDALKQSILRRAFSGEL